MADPYQILEDPAELLRKYRAGELQDDGLDGTGPVGEALVKNSIKARRALMNRNIAAMQPANPPTGPYMADQAAGTQGANGMMGRNANLAAYRNYGLSNGRFAPRLNIPQPVAPAAAINPDTPEDVERKARMSGMAYKGVRTPEGPKVVVSGGWPGESYAETVNVNSKRNPGAMVRQSAMANQIAEDAAGAKLDESASERDHMIAQAAGRKALHEKAMAEFNKRNAERVARRHPQIATTAGPMAAHLEGIYGSGNVPEAAWLHANEQDALTQRAGMQRAGETERARMHFMHDSPEKQAMAQAFKIKALQDLMALPGFAPKTGPNGEVIHHPVVKQGLDELNKQMGGTGPAPMPAPTPPPPGGLMKMWNKARAHPMTNTAIQRAAPQIWLYDYMKSKGMIPDFEAP